MNFRILGTAIAKQFQSMIPTGLFRVAIEKDKLWDAYLASFPAGSNPIYKTRTEHDCQCCKHFIRSMGGVVTIRDGRLVSIWDVRVDNEVYQAVAFRMTDLITPHNIENVFLHTESIVGTPTNRQLLEDSQVKVWSHFYVNLPSALVVRGRDIGPKLADTRSTKDVMLRSLYEITPEAVETVLELIAQNSLYRGEEHKFVVTEFQKLKRQFDQLNIREKEMFVWSNLGVAQSISRIRNTVIGTLLTDLSEGKELEDSVKLFESKVAPTNYKRPTALITKAMIEKAQQKVVELGFGTALERRYATIDDITVNNVLYANRNAKKAMNVFEEMSNRLPVDLKKLDRVDEVTIEDFINRIIPTAGLIEVLLENRHTSNLVSLVAPVDPTAKNMFKWPNNFSWSYSGELTDSIKERVKRAGGNVTGDLCCRLAWEYSDDLDFHMIEPRGDHIYYITYRRRKSPNGGELDLDANGCDGIRPDPAENVFYEDKTLMQDGVYTLYVENYNRRSDGRGFEVEIEFDGQVHHIAYDKPLKTMEKVIVAVIRYSKTLGFSIESSLPTSHTSKTVWSLTTQTFHKVNVLMMSPNHWDDRAVGNKHYFFMLEGCRNEGRARGFFNEFLTEELTPHRKVFEVVGAKMKTEESDRQLSGLGFSSTQRNNLLCRVQGSFVRTIKILF